MSKASDKLAASACWNRVSTRIDNALASMGDIVSLQWDSPELKAHVTDLINTSDGDQWAWVRFWIMALADRSLVTRSPEEWHYVTHGNSCFGARSTKQPGAGLKASALGVAARGQNAFASVGDLDAWHALQLAAGMDGLVPVWPQLRGGFVTGLVSAGPAVGGFSFKQPVYVGFAGTRPRAGDESEREGLGRYKGLLVAAGIAVAAVIL